MALRPVTTAELVALAPQLTAYADWLAMREFVKKVYGPAAVRAELVSQAEYNDEYYAPVIDFHVFDAAYNELQPDLAEEQAAVAEEKRAHEATKTWGYTYEFDDEMVAYSVKRLFHRRIALVAHIPDGAESDWAETKAFDLTQPPAVPLLYIADE